jgi:hypothetical protein
MTVHVANEIKGVIMDTVNMKASSITYAVIDSYAKEHFPRDYASLPDLNTIEIVTVPDEKFQLKGVYWPRMWDQRIQIGQLVEQQGGRTRRGGATQVYASATIHKARSFGSDKNSAISVRFSSSKKELSDSDWSNLQLIKPFNKIQAGIGRAASAERWVGGLAIYYLMANGQFDEFVTSSMDFLRDFKISCGCVAAMRQARPAPPLARDPTLLVHVPAPRLTDGTKEVSTRTLKRRREDEAEGSDRPDSSDQDAVEMPVSISRPCLDSSRC